MTSFLRYGLPVIGMAICVAAFFGLITLEVLKILPSNIVPPCGYRKSRPD
jgi:hypothetical protein